MVALRSALPALGARFAVLRRFHPLSILSYGVCVSEANTGEAVLTPYNPILLLPLFSVKHYL